MTQIRASAPKPHGPFLKSKDRFFSAFPLRISAFFAVNQSTNVSKEASRMSISKYVLLLSCLLLSMPIGAQQKAGTLKLKPYTFENSNKEKVESEFGTLFVPENRSNPESNLIELAFVRFKS